MEVVQAVVDFFQAIQAVIEAIQAVLEAIPGYFRGHTGRCGAS